MPAAARRQPACAPLGPVPHPARAAHPARTARRAPTTSGIPPVPPMSPDRAPARIRRSCPIGSLSSLVPSRPTLAGHSGRAKRSRPACLPDGSRVAGQSADLQRQSRALGPIDAAPVGAARDHFPYPCRSIRERLRRLPVMSGRGQSRGGTVESCGGHEVVLIAQAAD